MPKKLPIILITLACLLSLPALAQQSRIAQKIDNSQRITLRGHIHPRALPQYDQGAVDPSMAMPRVTVEIQPSPNQQADLKQLLAEQQNPSSPNYHKWLTPEQFADRFGASQDDINKIVQWLQSQHLTVTGVARARNAISFSGTAGAVQGAFGVEIHHYLVNGERHFANATEPSIPAAFGGVVSGIRGLNDFRLKPASRARAILPPGKLQPEYTSGSSTHYLAPGDIATIYNLAPLYSSGLNGSGQKLVVVGQTQIRLADIEQYRSSFNLPANDPEVVLVPNSTDPGISPGDLGESDLDLELSGAAAPNANIIFVYSNDVMVSAQYAIDQNLAPVLSISYGDCEAAYQPSDAANMQALAQQANAQGITWFAASGDNGAIDCYGDGFPNANSIASVDMPASLPEVTGVGGTEFVEGGGTYWNTVNNGNEASALSYIPETAWNDTAEDGSPSASGGGVSVYFAKPAWQTGPGVPNDGARDVPDIAISASADHDGYIIYSSDGCSTGRASATDCEQVVGGTSVGPPTMSGLAALLNQSLVSSGAQSAPGLGNINPQLYSLAQSTAASFHDVTTGNNIISVTCRSRGCTPVTVGYNAGPGYNLVTGLGSVDADVLLKAWAAGGSGSGNPGGTKSAGPAPVVTAVTNAASYQHTYAPGMLLTVFGSQLSPATQTASSVPLPAELAGVAATVNNFIAPAFFVSANQLNVQIPYEVPANSTAVLIINNNGQTTQVSFPVAAVAPGIFTDSNDAPAPNGSAAPGQTVTLFVTGAGAVTPPIGDGVAPSASTPLFALPAPQQAVTVTVGGIAAKTTFVGIPAGLVGVTQINYQVPAGVQPGPQSVVVTVGGVASAPATLTVN